MPVVDLVGRDEAVREPQRVVAAAEVGAEHSGDALGALEHLACRSTPSGSSSQMK